MKRRFITLLMVFVLCFSLFPTQAFAWKNLTHVNSADIILLEMKRSAKANSNQASVELGGIKYDVPKEFQDALFAYPDSFRAGSMGPDFYPDIVTGQMYMHPYYMHPYDDAKDIGSGEWITLLCDSLNKMPKDSEERKEALAFTLGVMLHYCGDLFGHDFINAFSGGAYPSLADVKYLDSTDPNLNYVLSHLAEEAYMDSLVNWGFYNNADYLNAKAPIQFVADSMIFDGSANGGAAKIFDKYGSVPPHFKYLIELRTTIYNKANEWRVSVNPIYSGAVMYLDAWIEDLDRATYALVGTFDNIANRLVTEADGFTIGIVKEELTGWLDKYGMYITPAPDALLTVMKAPGEITSAILQAIGAQTLLDAFNKWKNDLITDAVLWAIGIDEAVLNQHKARLEDPKVQLDHDDNPFKPSSNNFAEFKEYMDRFAMEQALLNGLDKQDLINKTDNGALDKLIDSDLEAFYNTMTMFKMVLIGSKNFKDFITFLSGETQIADKKNTGELAATSLKLQIATTDAQDAGTDDNIFAIVYKKGSSTPLIKKLLDISGYNDFEAGDNDEYFVELPEAVPVDEIEVHIKQEGTGLSGPGWDCANINITPMHAGTELTAPVGVGGNAKMNSGKTWNLRFQDALTARKIADKTTQEVMNLKIWINTKDKWGSGTDGDVYLVAYNGGSQWVKILLDKQGYNDFEAGDKDTYDVSLAKITEAGGIMTGEGIPLNKLTFKLVVEDNGTAGIGWDVEKAKVTPYYGNLALANKIDLGGYTDIRPGNEWWPDFQGRLSGSTGHGGGYTTYSGIELTYDTYVDDGLLAYMGSLDDSLQWRNEANILWKNTKIRKDVFLSVFKGFAPEIDFEIEDKDSATITVGADFDMEVTFDGFWNGITTERRRASVPYDQDKVVPSVSGTAIISFIDFKEDTVCDTAVTFKKGVAKVTDYSHSNLVPGVYDVKVTYQTDGEYASTEKVFKNALAVEAAGNYFVKLSASPEEGGNVSASRVDDDVKVTATPNEWYQFVGWTENGATVTEATGSEYTFTLTGNRDLVAEFKPILIDHIEVATAPDKVDYYVGDSFDSAGMVVKAVYENGAKKVIHNYTLSDTDNLENGQTEVTISYTEKGSTWTATQPITVEENDLVEINVTKEPDQLVYNMGDIFNTSGMEVEATYKDGTTKKIENYKVTDGFGLELGQTQVTISYTENGVTKTTTQRISVEEISQVNVLAKIEVMKEPDQTVYNVGDDFNATGMEVKATYNDGTAKKVEYYTVLDGSSLENGQTEVTISYTENNITKTTTQPITVNKSESAGTSSSEKRYSIAVEDSENGSVEVSRNRARKGVKITITTDAEEGYRAADISVVTKGSKVVGVNDIGNGKFTFTMPSANVNVKVNFEKAKNDVDILLTIGNAIAEVFGEIVVNDVPPVIRNERTMLPARFVAEALGAEVTWDEPNQKVMIVKEDITLEIFINEPFAVVNGTPVELDSPAFIENSRTYLPMRVIAENLGATVDWNAETRTIKITPGK